VTTGSTKSRSRKKKRGTNVSAIKSKVADPAIAGPAPRAISDRAWFIAAVVILLVAAVLRLYDLDLVPLHHDEGVNGNFLTRLVREGFYHYDPENYHGPTIYYFSAFIPWILRFLFGEVAQDKYGLNTITIRLVPALFGLATVWLVFLLRRQIGSFGTLAAATLIAISPGAVYLSRYFIHETLFVFFTLGLVIAALKYYDERHPLYLILAAISAALLFATKETALISAGVLIIALIVTHAYRYIRRYDAVDRRQTKQGKRASERIQKLSLVDRFGGPWRLALWGLIALVIFVGLNVLFYSSFFKNYPQGVYDSLRTFQFWTKTGKSQHVHSLSTYVYWLVRQESPVFFLGILGAAMLVWKPRNAFALFVALWGFGITAAYSLISYKTPWLGLNFIIPLALTGGYAVQQIYEESSGQLGLAAGILAAAVAISGYQTIDLNFFNYDNDDQYYVYVYAHTRREVLGMLQEIDRIAGRTQQGGQMGITIVAPEYWPLPWYFRDYKRVGYNGRMTTTNEPVIIAAENQGADVQTMFGDTYRQIPSGLNPAGSYALRPGVSFLLYVRRDVAPAGS